MSSTPTSINPSLEVNKRRRLNAPSGGGASTPRLTPTYHQTASLVDDESIITDSIEKRLSEVAASDQVDILIHLRPAIDSDDLHDLGLICAWVGHEKVLRYLYDNNDLTASHRSIRLTEVAAATNRASILELLVDNELAHLRRTTDKDGGDENNTEGDESNTEGDESNTEGDESNTEGDENDTEGDEGDIKGDESNSEDGRHRLGFDSKTYNFIIIAATRGHAEFIKRAIEMLVIPLKVLKRALCKAAYLGHMDVAQIVLGNLGPGVSLDVRHFDRVADYGSIASVKWLYENTSGRCSRRAMDAAAERGDFELIRFLHDRGARCTTRAMDAAAERGDFELIRFLHDRGAKCTTRAMDWAARKGNIAIVEFLHNNRSEGCTPKAISNALNGEHLKVAVFLHENRREGFDFNLLPPTTWRSTDIAQWVRSNAVEGMKRAKAYKGELYFEGRLCGAKGAPQRPRGTARIPFLDRRIVFFADHECWA